MNAKDEILQKQLPTLMVPHHEPLPPLLEGYSRLLMARDGLWIESKTAWGHFVRALWRSKRVLPYGALTPVETLYCKSIPMAFIERFLQQANHAAERSVETIAWILWSPSKGWKYLVPEILLQTAVRVDYRWPDLRDDWSLVVDLHSHRSLPARFSRDDDESDVGFPHFSVVLGHCKPGRGLEEIDHSLRLCLCGYYFEEELPWKREKERGL